jgi:hypothetical protein
MVAVVESGSELIRVCGRVQNVIMGQGIREIVALGEECLIPVPSKQK